MLVLTCIVHVINYFYFVHHNWCNYVLTPRRTIVERYTVAWCKALLQHVLNALNPGNCPRQKQQTNVCHRNQQWHISLAMWIIPQGPSASKWSREPSKQESKTPFHHHPFLRFNLRNMYSLVVLLFTFCEELSEVIHF